MIRNFRDRKLKRLYERGDYRGIHPEWRERVQDVLTLLDEASSPEEMDLPGLRLHQLKGNRAGYWSVTVSRNWRIIFRLEGEDVHDVSLIDYH